MEFPYPQSMKNCNTCHAGKMAEVTDPSNFRLEVCKSCHAREGGVNATGTVDTTEYSLVTLSTANFDSHPDLSHANAAADTIVCTNCHEGATAPTFAQIHGGYDSEIYMADGTRYSDTFSASIDAASVSDNVVTFSFSATESPDVDASPMNVSDIAPIVMVGLYGYDTKDFIVYTHDRFDSNGDGVVDRSDKSQLEYTVGDTDHPNFTTTSNPGDGTWEVTVDLSTWADMITDGAIKRIEIAVRPTLKVDVAHLVGDTESVTVALDAPSRTFDLAVNDFDDDFYDDIVNVATVTQADGSLSGCNTCHDALATTFHSADRGGNIKVCRMCHATLAGGSHLELQSRSIDSYVHAVHSFAPFDPGDVDLEDPVEYELYTLHREHTFPNFTIKNCEACHVAGGRFTNPPEQGSSLPGILSGTDNVDGRGLGDIESVVTGPGARACGACHRQHALNEGDDEKLIAVNAHTTLHGYALPDEDGVLDAVIDHIMSLFN
jgi:OmcA/MtrC family decaheme c-type cytochrome